jgi:hypothetical protein
MIVGVEKIKFLAPAKFRKILEKLMKNEDVVRTR